jgi:hypothetical protein
MIKMDGYNDCIAGTVERYGEPEIICYDKEKVLAKLEAQGMSEHEAIEFYYFNQLGACVGDDMPCYLTINENPIEE